MEGRSRRAILAAAGTAAAAFVASALERARPTRAAHQPGIGHLNPGSGQTTVSGSTAGALVSVLQSGAGPSLRASSGAGVAALVTSTGAEAISAITGAKDRFAAYVANDGTQPGAGGALRANGRENDGVVATTEDRSSNAVRAIQADPAGGTALHAETTGTNTPYLSWAIRGVNNDLGSSGTGILGLQAGSGVGVEGAAGNAGTGVSGHAQDNLGVYGSTLTGIGVWGRATSTTAPNIGVKGDSDSSNGIGIKGVAAAGNGIGMHGDGGPTGYGVWSEGNAHVNGTLTKTAGAFKIDHPLEPARKYLYHSFVESPDMKNLYDGIAELDAAGRATIQLPRWFEALNGEVRYQLTALGRAAPDLHVARPLSRGRFEIAGGHAGQRVCWQVTGIRRDAYAEAHRTPVEEDKPESEQGTFLHPGAAGHPRSRGLAARRAAGFRRPRAPMVDGTS